MHRRPGAQHFASKKSVHAAVFETLNVLRWTQQPQDASQAAEGAAEEVPRAVSPGVLVSKESPAFGCTETSTLSKMVLYRNTKATWQKDRSKPAMVRLQEELQVVSLQNDRLEEEACDLRQRCCTFSGSTSPI